MKHDNNGKWTDSNRNEESLAVFWFMFISINHQSTLFLYLYWMKWNGMEWIILEWSDEAFGNDKCSKYTKCQSSYNWNDQNWIRLLWFHINAENGSIESIENYTHGNNPFTQNQNGIEIDISKSFHILNCESLKYIHINTNRGCSLNNSRNNSFVIEGIDMILNI